MATGDTAVVTAPNVGLHNPASKGQAKTMQAMASGATTNPYKHFGDENADDKLSIDDGINMDESPDMSEKDRDEEGILNAMPGREEVAREFEEYLELMAPLSEQGEDDLRKKTIEEKWKIIFNEQPRECVYPVSTYITNLQKHLNLRKKKVSQKKMAKEGLGPLAFWLGKLKHDLKMTHESFSLEFVSNDHNGIDVLMDILKEIQHDQNVTMTAKKSKMDLYQQCQRDEYDCLLCLKFATKTQEGADQLIKCTAAVDTITQCISERSVKTKVVTLELLTVVCERPGGHQQVLAAFNDMHIKHAESVPFKRLVASLSKPGFIHFQTTCVRFFNKLATVVDNGNARVYLQHQLKLAGFDPDNLDRYFLGQGVEFECLQQELDTWRRNYINLNSSRQDMLDLEARNIALRKEIDRLQLQLLEFDKEREKWNKKESDLNEQCQLLRDRAAELQDLVDKLTHLLEEKAGIDPEKENIHVEHALSALDKYPTMRGLKGTIANASASASTASQEQAEQTSSEQQVPPTPPVPPPAPGLLSTTVRRKITMRSDTRLPLLHWTPMYVVKHTLFETIDDELMLREIDFTDFKKRFQLPNKMEGADSKEKRERALQKMARTITFVPSKRANNMIITQRRTGLTSQELRVAIDKCQTDKLPGEYAELLLPFMPTKEELKKLAEHKNSYRSLGEAEKFLFQMAQVERLETKLSMLAFMGIFDELTINMRPDMELVYAASQSALNSRKLRKVFEIILAFGNYMNSSKRGYVFGFRLESLTKLNEVRCTDKTTSLLHYIVELIETKYPDLAKFYEELQIDVPKGVSYQAIASDIHGLRKGLDLLKYEREKQPDNTTVEAFLKESSGQVTELWEHFKKMETSYRLLCLLLGENYKMMEPDDLFKYLLDFCAAFKQASLENYKAAHPEEFTSTSPLPTPRPTQQQLQAKVLAAEASKAAEVKSKFKDMPLSPDQVKLKPVSARVFRYPSDPKRKSVTTDDVTYDDDVFVRQSFRQPSNTEVNSGNIVLKKSSSKIYKAKSPEPIYSSVVKQPSVKDSKAAKSKSQEQAHLPKRLPRIPLIGSIGKRMAPRPPPAETSSKTTSPPSRPTSNIYEDIPADDVTKNSSLPNGGIANTKGPAPPRPGHRRSTSRGLADTKKKHSADQVSEALATLERVVNNPLWSTDEVIPEMTQDSKL